MNEDELNKFKAVVVETLEALGGCGSVAEISDYIHDKYDDSWENIGGYISQLCIDNESSIYPPNLRVLYQVSSGRFCLVKWYDTQTL